MRCRYAPKTSKASNSSKSASAETAKVGSSDRHFVRDGSVRELLDCYQCAVNSGPDRFIDRARLPTKRTKLSRACSSKPLTPSVRPNRNDGGLPVEPAYFNRRESGELERPRFARVTAAATISTDRPSRDWRRETLNGIAA